MFNYTLLETRMNASVKKNGWTMEEFAERIGFTKAGYYGALKKRTWQIERFELICKVIGAQPLEFWGPPKDLTPDEIATEMTRLAGLVEKMAKDNA